MPNWQMVKGDAFLISDFRNKTIAIAPLGFSVSGKVTADVVVVRSFEELERRKDEVGRVSFIHTVLSPNLWSYHYKLGPWQNRGVQPTLSKLFPLRHLQGHGRLKSFFFWRSGFVDSKRYSVLNLQRSHWRDG